ncbi:MAG: hypothetical protein IPN71_07230 [Fibrobacteres bacterium]|nr:hypothetical protein [Fibrobacterota bacterium]
MNGSSEIIELENRARLVKLVEEFKPVGTPLPGWDPPLEIGIGGLQSIGFSEDSTHLLAVSASGRGAFEVATGQRVGRDYDSSYKWLDTGRLTCEGIGSLEQQRVPIAGLFGGGLALTTDAGESVEKISPFWPVEMVVYSSGHDRWYSHPERCIVAYQEHAIVAHGFSPSGNCLVVAISSEIWIYNRSGKSPLGSAYRG